MKDTKVAIIKGKSPKECISDGIEKLGGISKYINEGDQVFIKFNLRLPNGFPTNTNFDVLEAVIRSCNNARAKKVYVGSFPFKGITIKAISDLLGLKRYFENLGAELAFLDNSDKFSLKGIKPEQLKFIKERSISKIEINNKEFIVPKVILESDKFILVNQVNVEPLYKCNLSLLNSYSIIPNKNQDIEKIVREGKDYLYLDQYRQDLTSNIVDVFTIKEPDLIINDLFYLLEGAGPYIYKDSNLKNTNIIVMGNDAVAIDIVTLKILNLDILKNDILLEARERKLSPTELSKIKVIGEKIEDINIDIEPCVSKLEDINLRNFFIKSGRICSGCFKQAYHLLNLMKTNMVKDLKYISKSSILIGENPLEPESESIILCGDCAINSTKDRSFRKIIKESKKKTKEKINKNVLELPGCPPDIFNCIELLVKYYGKGNVPTLNLFYKTIKSYDHRKIKEKLEIWEAL